MTDDGPNSLQCESARQPVIDFHLFLDKYSYVHYDRVGTKWGLSPHICVALIRGSPGASEAGNVEDISLYC